VNRVAVAQTVLGAKAPSRGPGELANLDFLRAVAVCLVFLNHLGPPLGIPGVAALGHLGVLLFFVHTALVLMMSMERLRLDGWRLYRTFMIRRIFRIYPLSILAVFLLAVFPLAKQAWGFQFGWPGWEPFVSNVALVQNVTASGSTLGVLWSLPFEVQMYALLPLLFLWLRQAGGVRAAAWGWLAAAGVALAEYWIRGAPNIETGLLTRYFPCFLGGLLAWQSLKVSQKRWPGWLWPACVASLVVGYRVLWLVRDFGPGVLIGRVRPSTAAVGMWWPGWVEVLVEGAFCALVGLAIPWFREIRWGWLKTAGKLVAQYSYGIYLSHSAAIWLCFAYWPTRWAALNLLGSVVLTGTVSVATYHLLEQPGIELGKRVAERWGEGSLQVVVASGD